MIEPAAETIEALSNPAPTATVVSTRRRRDVHSDSRLLGALGRYPQLSALAAALCIAFSGILVREAAVSPTTAAAFRAGYAIPFLAVVAFLERRRLGPRPLRRRAWAWLAGAFFAVDLVLFHHSIELIGAGLGSVMANVQVIYVAVIAWLIWHERPSTGQFIGIPVALFGVLLISGALGGSAYGANPALGVVVGLGTAAAYAGYLLLIRKGRDRARVAGPIFDASVATAVTAALIGVVDGDFNVVPSWPAHGWLVVLALTAQFAGGLLIAIALPRLPAVQTSLLLLTQPVIAVLAAMLLIAETPSAFQLLGVALVVLGVAIGTLRIIPRGRGLRDSARSKRAIGEGPKRLEPDAGGQR